MNGYQIQSILYKSERVTVSRAIRDSDGKSVILKSQNTEYPSLRELTRIQYEFELSRKYPVLGLVPIYTLEKTDNIYTLVMEDVDGIPLLIYWNTTTKSLPLFLNLAIQITEILSRLHKTQIIHKDIKPANILVQKDTGKVYLIDLGLASLLRSEEQAPVQPESLEGTLTYISPEQTGRMNRSIDFRSDLYSLGITFYELLTGKLPFEGTDPVELVHAHIALSPKSPLEINSEIPSCISDLILKLLSKNAEERYQSADGLEEDLILARELLLNHKPLDFIPGERESRGIFSIPQKLYGREAEVSFLLEAFERISSPGDREPEEGSTEKFGGVKLVLVGGYSGVGKTALINEVHKPILEKRGYFLSGKFDQFKRNIPYASLIQAFTGLVRQILTEREEKIEYWKVRILQACSPNVVLLTDLIPELIHITGNQSPIEELPPQESEERFQKTFLNFVSVFASLDHPLTLFVDDLQWADLPTLKFLELLTKSDEMQHLLLLGAFRDNEVDSLHPLTLFIQALEKEKIHILKIFLAPLMEFFIERMICDTLHKEVASELPELIYKKTGGNPFFVRQLLKTLYQDGCIFYKQGSGWSYNLQAIQSANYTENVVELVAKRLQTMSEETREILKIASCLGASFSLSLLSLCIAKTTRSSALALRESLLEGILIPENSSYRSAETLSDNEKEFSELENISYKFLHDRVQQAANSLLTKEEEVEVHIKISKILLTTLNEAQLEDSIFEVVSHLNYVLLTNDPQIDFFSLVELNFRAGKKASLSNAIQPALNYLQISYDAKKKYLIKDNFIHPELEFNIEYELGISLYLNGKFQESENLFLEILSKTTDQDRIFKVQNMRIILYINQGMYEMAIELGLKTLKMYGINIHPNPTNRFIFLEYLKIKKLVVQISNENLLEKESIQNKKIINCLQVLVNIYTAAYFTNINLCNLLILNLVEITFTYGNSPFSGMSTVTYANFCIGLGEYKQGYDYGLLSLKLNERYGNDGLRAKIIQYLTGFILHWNKPLVETVSLHEEGFRIARDLGDNLYSAFLAWFLSANQDSLGLHLEKVLDLAIKYYNFTNSINYSDIGLGIKAIIQRAKLLLGKTKNLSLEDESFNEKDYLAKCHNSKMKVHLIYYYYTKARISFLFGEFQNAVDYCIEARKRDEYIIGMECLAEIQFYQCISISSLVSNEPDWNDSVFEKNKKNFKKWSETCPNNFADKYFLILAEEFRIKGQDKKALEYYNLAIEFALKYDFIQNAGIASEMTAKFYLSLNIPKLSTYYLKDAMTYYHNWGASTKVKDLENKYSLNYISGRIEDQSHEKITTRSIHQVNTFSLDIQSILKATQALSTEIKIENLLIKLMFIVLENAGATRGLLLLMDKETLLVEVEGKKATNHVEFLKTPAQDYKEIPLSILQYVLRTSESVILDSASSDERFQENPYIQRVKLLSLLCMPILSKGICIGILYLENTLMKGAFTKNRIEVLNMITSQAAISIENARLYDNLENKVQERTIELDTQKKRLEKIQSFTKVIQNVTNFEEMAREVHKILRNFFKLENYFFYICNTLSSKIELLRIESNGVLPEYIIKLLYNNSIPYEENDSFHVSVMKYGKSIFLKNASRGKLSYTENLNRDILGITSIYIIPLINSGNVFALLSFADIKPEYQPEKTLYNITNLQREDIELLCQSIASGLYQSLQKKELELQKKSIEDLNLFIKSLNESLKVDIILNKIKYYVNYKYNLEHIALGIVDENGKYARFTEFSVDVESSIKEKILSLEIPIVNIVGAHARAFKSNEILYIKKISFNRITIEEKEILNICKFKSFIIIPLILNGKNIGFLDLGNIDRETNLTKEQISQLSILSEQLAGIIYSSNLYKEIQVQKQELESTLTELRSTQAQLVEAEKSAALGQLISGVAHEINNPLAAIRSSAEILEMDQDKIWEEIPIFFQKSSPETLTIFLDLLKESERNKKYQNSKEERQRKKKIHQNFEAYSYSSENIKEETLDLISELWIEDSYQNLREWFSDSELLQILKYVSLYSIQKNSLKNIKLSTEKSARIIFSLRKYLKTSIRGTFREVSLTDLLESSFKVYNNYIQGIIQIERNYSLSPIITCVVDEIQQVFKNLIFNAIQAMYLEIEKKLIVQIDSISRSEKNFIRVIIEDSGTGISSDVTHKLFTPFFTTKSRGEGIGLGLHVSKTILEEHGGTLEYEALKKGSRFIVKLIC